MKRLFILMIGWSLSIVSCNKSSTLPGKTFSENITGKWRYAQYYYSNGGPLIYVSTGSLNQWIAFDADGRFTSNMPGFEKITSYKLMDSSRVTFFTPLRQPDFRLYYYSLDSTDGSLSLSRADILCIEGCGDKFKR
ncbi:MAG: hypothetical protein ABI834_00425 [Ginsengibacter sp.]